MSKVKEVWSKLNPKAAMVGGALVITTSIGTCQLTKPEAKEPTVEETPLIVPVEEPVEEPEIEAEDIAAEAPEAPESE